MQENIELAEDAINDTIRLNAQGDANLGSIQAGAAVSVASALVAIAKGLKVVGAVMYLTHLERGHGAQVGSDSAATKLDSFVREGLGL